MSLNIENEYDIKIASKEQKDDKMLLIEITDKKLLNNLLF